MATRNSSGVERRRARPGRQPPAPPETPGQKGHRNPPGTADAGCDCQDGDLTALPSFRRADCARGDDHRRRDANPRGRYQAEFNR
jgi:hypothetical protein